MNLFLGVPLHPSCIIILLMEARPLDIIDMIKSVSSDSLPDSIYQYDKESYYAGANEYGTTYIISENRSYDGLDGVVAYFGADNCGMDVWFRAPNITPKEFHKTVQYTEQLLGVSFQIKLYSETVSERAAEESDFSESISDDSSLYMLTDEQYFYVEGIYEPYMVHVQLHGYDIAAKKTPVFWSLDEPPEYGQDKTVKNEIWICVSYPGCA